jgi:hypothetical protein
MVVGVEEAAVADLPLLDQMDAQDCATRDEESVPASRRDDDVF